MKSVLTFIFFWVGTCIFAQPKAEFPITHNKLGEVKWQMPTRLVFEVQNVGDQPLQLIDVVPDCDCTAAQWSEAPIEPGKKGEIVVLFDATLLGTFQKSIAVLTNENQQPTYLHFSGKVVKNVKYTSADFNSHMGEIHTSTDVIEFNNVQKGEMPKATITIFNGSSRAFHPELMFLPDYLSAVSMPDYIEPGQIGELHIELNSNLLRDMGLTQTSVYLSRFIGDRISPENEISISATVIPQLSVSPEQLKFAPQIELSDTLLTIGDFGKKKKLKKKLLIKNTGASDLNIERIQLYNPGMNISINKSSIKPGESAKVNITLFADNKRKGSQKILLITNDPRKPQVIIELK
ncbi:MAG: DUF1573 domain-containing protein [Bacteroidaceae bacterium]|nr:DUF1573 domain-containing protein [Bacteroidaceae bacterium]